MYEHLSPKELEFLVDFGLENKLKYGSIRCYDQTLRCFRHNTTATGWETKRQEIERLVPEIEYRVVPKIGYQDATSETPVQAFVELILGRKILPWDTKKFGEEDFLEKLRKFYPIV